MSLRSDKRGAVDPSILLGVGIVDAALIVAFYRRVREDYRITNGFRDYFHSG